MGGASRPGPVRRRASHAFGGAGPGGLRAEDSIEVAAVSRRACRGRGLVAPRVLPRRLNDLVVLDSPGCRSASGGPVHERRGGCGVTAVSLTESAPARGAAETISPPHKP
jgi:hypothetical protein